MDNKNILIGFLIVIILILLVVSKDTTSNYHEYNGYNEDSYIQEMCYNCDK